MSATSKRDRALKAGLEPVTDKSIHMGDEPMPEYLDTNMAAAPEVVVTPEVVAAPEVVAEPEEQENDDG